MASRIVATSDLHGHLPDMPECDILIIAGDVCPMEDHDVGYQLNWLDRSFRAWLEAQPAKHIIGIAGNHDFAFEYLNDAKQAGIKEKALELPWTYLLDSGTEIEGIKFWGLPWVPNLRGWAFYGDDIQLETSYQSVPKDTDVVISHGPPKGLLDFTNHKGGGHVGSEQALSMLDRVNPKAFVCGHIHEGFGKDVTEAGTDVYNVAYVDEAYIPRYATVVLDGF